MIRRNQNKMNNGQRQPIPSEDKEGLSRVNSTKYSNDDANTRYPTKANDNNSNNRSRRGLVSKKSLSIKDLRESVVNDVCSGFSKMFQGNQQNYINNNSHATAPMREDSFLSGGGDDSSAEFTEQTAELSSDFFSCELSPSPAVNEHKDEGYTHHDAVEPFSSSPASSYRNHDKAPQAEKEEEEERIEVAPGHTLPFVRSNKTLQCVLTGSVIVCSCSCCGEDLTCIDYATVAICGDCWVFTPIEANIPDEDVFQNSNVANAADFGAVSLGIKTDDIVQWLSLQQQQI